MSDVSPNNFSSKGYSSKGTDKKLKSSKIMYVVCLVSQFLSKGYCSKGTDKKWTSSKMVYLVCLVVIIITIPLIVLFWIINTGISSSLNSKLRAEVSRTSTLQELELLKIKYLNILSGLKYNELSGLITDGNSNVIKLIREFSINSRLKDATVNKHIDLILNASYGRSVLYPAPSCQAISISYPAFQSDYYWVSTSSGSRIVYCDLTTICGNTTGGLTRVGVLNQENRRRLCNGDFVDVDHNSRCIRSNEEPGCSHIVFNVWNISYSHVCGSVESYWLDTPDGFTGSSRSNDTTINDNYVDGISLTYGKAPNRSHIWTFIADENTYCNFTKPDYVGNNFSCLQKIQSCQTDTHLCTHSFSMHLQKPTTENIELRLCRDQHQKDEHIYLGNLEIYVR